MVRLLAKNSVIITQVEFIVFWVYVEDNKGWFSILTSSTPLLLFIDPIAAGSIVS